MSPARAARAVLSTVRPLLWAAAGVALVTMLLRALPHTDTTVAALVYTLVILVVATRAPLLTTVLTAAVAIIPFHFFFVPVFESFVVTDPLDWLVLGTFLAVGVTAGELASRARHRAERAQAAALAVQRAELSSALLASLSHDLRTPIAATRVAVANASDEQLPRDERRRQAALALEQVERLDRTLHGILDLARVQAQGLTLHPQWVSPADIVEAAIARAHVAAAAARLRLRVDEEVEVHADPRLVASALTYVLENALQYAPGDGTILVEGGVADGAVRIAVSDSGPGFHESEVERLFEAFYRGDRGAQRKQGTGLGLTIARGLLRAQGGTIRAEPVQPHGARFVITVPCRHRPASVDVG